MLSVNDPKTYLKHANADHYLFQVTQAPVYKVFSWLMKFELASHEYSKTLHLMLQVQSNNM